MFKFKFHDIAEGVNEGKVGEIFVKPGDKIKEGQDLVVVETDKITTELTSPVDGVISKVNIKTGQDITVGDVIIEIDDNSTNDKPEKSVPKDGKKSLIDVNKEVSEKLKNLLPPDEENASVVGTVTVGDVTLSPRIGNEDSENKVKSGPILTSPLARRIARDNNINLNNIQGTGPNGRIIVSDLNINNTVVDINVNSQNAIINQQSGEINPSLQVVETDNEYTEPISQVRTAIARAMTQSVYTIPHTTLMDEVDLTKISRIRSDYKIQWDKDKMLLSYMPFIIKAVTIGLEKYPIINARLDLNKKLIIFYKKHNIGVAAATKTGLKVPVMKDVKRNSVKEIGDKLKEIVVKIKADKFTMNDFITGTFTITNYGSLGAQFGTPVINYPESAILGVGRVNLKPRYNKDLELEPRQMMGVSIAFDHRLIDGAIAAEFLTFIKKILEDPSLLAIY